MIFMKKYVDYSEWCVLVIFIFFIKGKREERKVVKLFVNIKYVENKIKVESVWLKFVCEIRGDLKFKWYIFFV